MRFFLDILLFCWGKNKIISQLVIWLLHPITPKKPYRKLRYGFLSEKLILATSAKYRHPITSCTRPNATTQHTTQQHTRPNATMQRTTQQQKRPNPSFTRLNAIMQRTTQQHTGWNRTTHKTKRNNTPPFSTMGSAFSSPIDAPGTNPHVDATSDFRKQHHQDWDNESQASLSVELEGAGPAIWKNRLNKNNWIF
jgi:hypothetical protein